MLIECTGSGERWPRTLGSTRRSGGRDWTAGIAPSRHHSADMDWPVEACPPTGLANFEVTCVSRSDIVTLRHAERDGAIAALEPRIASSMLLSVAGEDRKSGVAGKGCDGRVSFGGQRNIKK